MNEPELNPCPFCGGMAEILKQGHREYAPSYSVRCKICRASSVSEFDVDKAVERWNRRI